METKERLGAPRTRGGWFSIEMLSRVYLPLALIVLPMLILLGFVHRYGVNVLYWDDWANVDAYRQLTAAKTNWWQLFRTPDFEDLMFFPKLANFLVERLTYFNTKPLMYCNVLVQAGACALLLLMSVSSVCEDEHGLWYLVPLPWLMFSLGQHSGLFGVIFGDRLGWYMITFFCFLAIYLLSHSSERSVGQRVSAAVYFWLAAGSGFIASFSSLHGLLVWPVGGMYLWLRGQEHSESSRKNWKVSAWAVLSAATVFLYLATLDIHNIGAGSGGKSPGDLLRLAASRPFYALAYYCANIGAIFLHQTPGRAITVGLILLAAAGLAMAHLGRAPNRWAYALPAALITFGLLFSILLLGRLPSGVYASVGYFYSFWTIHIMPLVIGLYLYSVQVARVTAFSRSGKVLLNVAWVVFLVLLTANNIYYGIRNGRFYRFQRYLSVATLLDYPHESTTKLTWFLTNSNLPALLEDASFLKQNRLSVFHQGQGDVPVDVQERMRPPASYLAFEDEHADYREALEQLFDVYLMGDDLQRAFDPAASSFTHDLVLWAGGEARAKNHYLHPFLDKYGTQYIALMPEADGLLIRQGPK